MSPPNTFEGDARHALRESVPATPASAESAAETRERIDARLAHLFRASLKSGRLHPLYLPMHQYRHAGHTA